MLFTLVEPRRGHEVAYNRWYERDHLLGLHDRSVPVRGKALRGHGRAQGASSAPDPSAVTGEPGRGSFLSMYWVLDGYHDVWNRWAVDQVKALHKAGRMFDERDHVHTLLYRYAWERPRDRPTAFPPSSPSTIPRPGSSPCSPMVPRVSTPASTRPGSQTSTCRAAPGTPARLVIAADPLPLLIDAPGGRAPHRVRRPPPADPVVPRHHA